MAIALLRLTEILHGGPSLATAPSNTAANNLARGLGPYDLRVGRYGLKVPADLQAIPTVAAAEAAEGTPDGCDAKRRRKQFETRHLRTKVDVACGTLMSAGLPHLESLDYPFVLVDEAGQATEPETIVGLTRAGQGAHVLLIDRRCRRGDGGIDRRLDLEARVERWRTSRRS